MPAKVVSATPSGDETGVDPESSVLIRIEDRSGTVDVNSVSLTLDGIDAGGSIEKSGGSTSIIVDRSGHLWLPNQTVTLYGADTIGTLVLGDMNVHEKSWLKYSDGTSAEGRELRDL